MLEKQTVFTTITPLPSYITRETVVETLHDHKEMIELNPLVINHTQCRPSSSAPADEYHCIWYELTDRISYGPGGIISGKVSYKACFYDLPRGLQTHVYAPTGLDIRDKWSICGNMPGEPREQVELGLADAPREGLYLREDIDMRCQIWATGFVKKTLRKSHAVLVQRLVLKADLLKDRSDQGSLRSGSLRSSSIPDYPHMYKAYSPDTLGLERSQRNSLEKKDVVAELPLSPSANELPGSLPSALLSGPLAKSPRNSQAPEIQVNGIPESKQIGISHRGPSVHELE